MPSLQCCVAVCRGMRTARHIIKENCKIYVRNELKCKPNSTSSPLTTTTPINSASATMHSRRMSISCCTCCKHCSSNRTTRQRRHGGSLKGKDTARSILRLKLQSETSSSRLLEAKEFRVRVFLFYPHSGYTHTHTHTHQHEPHMQGTSVGAGNRRAHGGQAAVANIAAATLGHMTSPADTLTHTHTHTQRTQQWQEGAHERVERARARALARALRQQKINCST